MNLNMPIIRSETADDIWYILSGVERKAFVKKGLTHVFVINCWSVAINEVVTKHIPH